MLVAIDITIGVVGGMPNLHDGIPMTVARTCSALYSLARSLGDYQAVKNGRIGKRIASVALKRRHR